MESNKIDYYGEEHFTMMVYSRDSAVDYVQMNWKVPVDVIESEYNNVKDSLVIHRPEDGHKDWCAVTLYGVDSDKTNSHWEYGLRARKKVTDVGKKCPKTMEWISTLPIARLDDVRFLVIKPGGYIAPHIDVPDRNWLEPINICITWPAGSEFIHNGKQVPYKPGMSLVLNIHYEHQVKNNSNEERLHLLIHGKKKKEFWNDAIS